MVAKLRSFVNSLKKKHYFVILPTNTPPQFLWKLIPKTITVCTVQFSETKDKIKCILVRTTRESCKTHKLTAVPDDGSIKSAQYPAARRLLQISFALSTNCNKKKHRKNERLSIQ